MDGALHLKALALQKLPQDLPVEAVVLHHQDLPRKVRPRQEHVSPLGGRLLDQAQRQRHIEAAAFPWGAVHRDLPSHELGQTPGDGQSQPGAGDPAQGRVSLPFKGGKQPLLEAFPHSDPRISHR